MAPIYFIKHVKEETAVLGGKESLQSTKATTFPVLPPTFFKLFAALERIGPAAAVTRERPSEALEAAVEADSLALAAVSVEECLIAVLRIRNCDWRRTARDGAVAGILTTTKYL